MRRHSDRHYQRSRQTSQSTEEDWDIEDARFKLPGSSSSGQIDDQNTDTEAGAKRSGRGKVLHTGPERLTDVLSPHWQPTTTRRGRHRHALILPPKPEVLSPMRPCKKKKPNEPQTSSSNSREKSRNIKAGFDLVANIETSITPGVESRIQYPESRGTSANVKLHNQSGPSGTSSGIVPHTTGNPWTISSITGPSENVTATRSAIGTPSATGSSFHPPADRSSSSEGEQAIAMRDGQSIKRDHSKDSQTNRMTVQRHCKELQLRITSSSGKSGSSSGLSDPPSSPRKSSHSQSRSTVPNHKKRHSTSRGLDRGYQHTRVGRPFRPRTITSGRTQPDTDLSKNSSKNIKDPPFVGANPQSRGARGRDFPKD